MNSSVPCADDKAAIDALKGVAIDASFYPFTFGWFCLVSKFNQKVQDSWTGSMIVEEAAQPVAAADEDELDLFGSDNEDDTVSTKRYYYLAN